ncbi:class I SAM-dependent RNA methyltransferase [Flindersiella endophytica]
MPDELIELDVATVANGGWCVARYEGRVVFVRHALPGERVRARVVEQTKRFWRADAVEILRGSNDRVDPPCKYAGPGKCGGCDWQHATAEAQRTLKAQVVADQLRRLAGIERDVTVEELPGTPDNLGWRTRVRFAVAGNGRLGFRRHRSHNIQVVDQCPIAHPEVEQLGAESLHWKGFSEVEAIAAPETADRLVLVDADRPPIPRLDAKVRVVRGKPAPGPALPYVREQAAGRSWQVSGSGFWQVHPAAAQTLVDAVIKALHPQLGETALDLYCGVGLFTGVLADHVGPTGHVLGIESDPIAVHDAQHNLRDLPNADVEAGKVERTITSKRIRPVDLIVVDPPRTGLEEQVVTRIAKLARRRIAYVSCDPATLARDLGRFAKLGWQLSDLRAFDAFPMTHHVECVATLDR